jgi:hypothetical protein
VSNAPTPCKLGMHARTMWIGEGSAGDAVRLPAMSHVTPIVFVVDDDISVRESLELLIRNAGWQPETFESAQEFLSRPRAVTLRDSGTSR